MLTSFPILAEPKSSIAGPAQTNMNWIVPSNSQRREAADAATGGHVLHFGLDAQIYGDGDANASFYRVVSGVARTCKFRSDGRRQIDAFYVAGDMFGFDAGDRHRFAAEAVSECVIAAFRWSGFTGPGAIDSRFAAQFFLYAMQNLQRAQEHSLLLGRRSASQKVAAFLVEMSDRSGGEDVIDLVMARQDIADYLGLTIETVSRTLSHLEAEAVIALPSARRVCLLNRHSLRRLCA